MLMFDMFKGWTRTHSYFTIMGGFFDSRNPGNPLLRDAKAIDNLTVDSHPEMFKINLPVEIPPKDHETMPEPSTLPTQGNPPSKPWILVSESEILDKGKSNPLAKLFAVLQTLWFIIQYFGRWAADQPKTQLEVVTLAYAAI